MPREILSDDDFRRKMQFGLDQVANTIKTTLGPTGRNAVIQQSNASPLVTNDGATIAKEIELKGYAENIGAKLIKEVALRTNEVVGDGTTTSAVLAQHIIHDGFKNIAAGANPVEMKKGIQGATQLAAAAIKKLSVPVKTRKVLSQVAAISAEDPVIGELIADAMEKVGTDGSITVEESKAVDTTLDVMVGMQFDRGYLSPEMVTDSENMVAELANPYILITDRKISNSGELLPLLDQVVERGRALVIVAEAVEGEALGMLGMNIKNGVLNAVAIHPPAYGDGRRARMEDLALLTGAVFITEEFGYSLRGTTVDMLGSAAAVRVERGRTVFLGGAGDKEAVAARIRYLRMLIEKTAYDFDKKQLEERLAKLSGGVATIRVGAVTEVEMKEKKLRVEDALHAARAAVAEGIVPGGGVAYINTLPAVRAYVKTLTGDMKIGAEIILRALEAPARQIAENAGLDGGAVAAEVMRYPKGVGFDASAEEYRNMMEAGIVDSAKVTRVALQNAASAAAVLLTTETGVLYCQE